MACKPVSARKARFSTKPPFEPSSCAWQTRAGRDGKQYTSQPNNLGQFTWVLAKVPRGVQLRRAAREYGPQAAEAVVRLAGGQLYKKMLPGHDYYNMQTAWQGRKYYTYLPDYA